MTQDYRIKNYTPKNNKNSLSVNSAFNALMLLVGRQEGHPACKKTEWWGADVVICLERGASLHMAQLIHRHSLSLASVKSRLVLPFWYWLTWVVPDKGPLNVCVLSVDSHANSSHFIRIGISMGILLAHGTCGIPISARQLFADNLTSMAQSENSLHEYSTVQHSIGMELTE